MKQWSPNEAFEAWWRHEGSGMPPLPGEDAEAHVKRICRFAWLEAADWAQGEVRARGGECVNDSGRDAARYRWIKAAPGLRIERMPDSHFWISAETGEKYHVTHNLSAFETGFSGLPTLDDLVDQAMEMYPIVSGPVEGDPVVMQFPSSANESNP